MRRMRHDTTKGLAKTTWLFFILAASALVAGILVSVWPKRGPGASEETKATAEEKQTGRPGGLFLPVASAGMSLPTVEAGVFPVILITSRPMQGGGALQSYSDRLPLAGHGEVSALVVSRDDLRSTAGRVIRSYLTTQRMAGESDGPPDLPDVEQIEEPELTESVELDASALDAGDEDLSTGIGRQLVLLAEPNLPYPVLSNALQQAADAGVVRIWIGCVASEDGQEIVVLPLGIPDSEHRGGPEDPRDPSSGRHPRLASAGDGWRIRMVSDAPSYYSLRGRGPAGSEESSEPVSRKEALSVLKLCCERDPDGFLSIDCSNRWTVQDFVDALDLGVEAGYTTFAIPRKDQ